ncbi:MAG: tRNA pseudouridine(55) synthase TruB, partial [Syntrophomonadaceae bacterium]|nr:tRNA pseudouridine(55) synthase TruB [Syntrophomonadaceae bacterium]
MHRRGLGMDGLVNLLKPPGMSSHDAVNWLRRRLGFKRIGHLGTLDPAAAGVLPLCLGTATRLAEYMAGWDKEYRAEMVLGVVTDSQDTSGEVRSLRPGREVDAKAVREALQRQVGTRRQVPPMVSAVKFEGRRLYKLAREGREVEPPPREITVHFLRLKQVLGGRPFCRVVFDARVSKGTYIRTLCHDIGLELGCGGALAFLVRTRVGPFRLEEAWSREEIEEEISRGLDRFILPSDFGILEWPAWTLAPEGLKRIQHGREVGLADVIKGEAPAG